MPATQAINALVLMLLGFAFGVALDLYRVIRRLINPGLWLTVACDLLFWLAYTAWVFATLVRFNHGEVRFYIFLSLVAGAAVYFSLLSKTMLKGWYTILHSAVVATAWLLEKINQILDVIISIVLWPYRILSRYLLYPIYRLIRFFLAPVLALYNWLVQKIHQLLNWLARPMRLLLRKLRAFIDKLLEPPTIEP